jgi:hypothetical protein
MKAVKFLSPDGETGNTEVPTEGVEENQAALAHAVGRYRELVASAPGLVPELVGGSTIEEVDASVEAARQAYEAVSRRIAEQHEARVPTGNPARSSADAAATALKPEAKIALGLRKL